MGERLLPVPVALTPERVVTILAVCDSDEDRASLNEILTHSKWRILFARSCQEAAEILNQVRIPVVVSSCALPDGCWRNVLDCVEQCPGQPLLVVASRQADDRLWAEVLNLGGYDVLSKPFDRAEVVRVLGSAWLHWRQRATPRVMQPRKPVLPLVYRATA